MSEVIEAVEVMLRATVEINKLRYLNQELLDAAEQFIAKLESDVEYPGLSRLRSAIAKAKSAQ